MCRTWYWQSAHSLEGGYQKPVAGVTQHQAPQAKCSEGEPWPSMHMAPLNLFIFSCEEQHQARAPWALGSQKTMHPPLHDAGTKPGVSKASCHEAMPTCTQGSQALAGQGSSPPESRTARAHHCGKQAGVDKTGTLLMPSPVQIFLGWEFGSRDRHRMQGLNDDAQRKRRMPGQAAGSWSPSREVLRLILLRTSSDSYRNKGDA